MKSIASALAAFTVRVVPTHLRQVYFADLALFLSAVGLVVHFVGADSFPQALLSGGALAAAALLMHGWAWDCSTSTKNGASVIMAVWAGQLSYLVATFVKAGHADHRDVASVILGLGFLVLASGLWFATVAGRGERGLWWLRRHRSPSV